MNSTTDIVGWAPEPRGRGTIGLLWSCFATLFLGTWTAIHPNLPGLKEKKISIFWRRIEYVVFCLVAPELTAFNATEAFGTAQQTRKELKAIHIDWSLKKCFFLHMGGFVVKHKHDQDVLFRSYRVLPKKLLRMFKAGLIPWPEMSDEQIDDRSKANGLVKGLASIQIVWFIIQLIGRWVQGLSVTTLELFTLGIVFCAMFAFVGCWEKPYDVQIPATLQTTSDITEEDHIDRILTTAADEALDDRIYLGIFSAICLVFGAAHIVAWNSHFPSFSEQLLWRICSIGITVLPLLITVVFASSDTLHISDALESWIVDGLNSVYMLFRLYMFVEMFASLRAVPASVY